MTSKKWQIKGAHHSIKEGSYTTTLKLILLAPSLDIINTKSTTQPQPTTQPIWNN